MEDAAWGQGQQRRRQAGDAGELALDFGIRQAGDEQLRVGVARVLEDLDGPARFPSAGRRTSRPGVHKLGHETHVVADEDHGGPDLPAHRAASPSPVAAPPRPARWSTRRR